MSTEESATNEYTQISSYEERFYIFGIIVLGSMGLIIACFIFWRLKNIFKSLQALNEDQSHSNYYYHFALRTAQISVLCSIIFYVFHIFFVNNLVIPWNYKRTPEFMTIFDSVMLTFWFFGKVVYYFSFTYHVHSIFDELMSLSLKIWMVLMTLSFIICSILLVIGDILDFSESELGITEGGTFIVGEPEAEEAERGAIDIITPMLILTDIIYFGILLFVYTSKLRKIARSDNISDPSMTVQSVKGIILVSLSCFTFWIMLISLMTEADSRYLWICLDTVFDDICLFLMFRENDDLYQSLCCCVHLFCSKMIVGKAKYEAISRDETNEETEEN